MRSNSNMEKSLECPICFNEFVQPKLLSCLHTFCLKCLKRYWEEEIDEDSKPCPMCRREFFIPEGGVEQLENDPIVMRLITEKRFKAGKWGEEEHCEICESPEEKVDAKHFCVECKQRFCDKCKQFHLRQRISESHKLINVENRPGDEEMKGLGMEYCSEHKTKEIELYCCQCKELLCQLCYATEHRNHECKTPANIAKSKKLLLDTSRENLEKCLGESKCKIDGMKQLELEFMDMVTECLTAVEGSFSGTSWVLKDYRDQLKRRFDEIKGERMKEIVTEKDRHQLRQTELDSFITYSRMVMERGRDCEIIRVADKLHKRAEELIRSQDEYNKQVLTDKSVRFCAPTAQCEEEVQHLVGRIQYKGEWNDKKFEVSDDIQAYYKGNAQVVEELLLALMTAVQLSMTTPLADTDSTDIRNKLETCLREFQSNIKLLKEAMEFENAVHIEENMFQRSSSAVQEIIEKFSKQINSLSEYKRKLEELDEQVVGLSKKNDELKNRNSDLISKLNIEINEKRAMKSETEKLGSEKNEIKKELAKQTTEHISKLKQANDETNRKESEITKIKSEMDKQKKELDKQMSNLTSKLKQANDGKSLKELEISKLKAEKEKELIEHNKTIASMESKLSEAVKAKDQAVLNLEKEKKMRQETEAKLSQVQRQQQNTSQDFSTFRTLSGKLRILVLVGSWTDDDIAEQKIYQINLDRENTINVINSTPAYISREPAACVINNELYAVGIGTEYNELWKWSAEKGEWTRLADLPSGRRRHCVTPMGQKIYVLGGWVDADKRTLDSVLCYDIKSNNWTQATQLCHAVYSAVCVKYERSIYVFGGGDKDAKSVNHVQVYDTSTGEVTLSSNPMPAAKRQMRAVLWGSKALFIGERNCYIYDFERRAWEERNRFKADVNQFGLTLNHDTLYISGGRTNRKEENNKYVYTDEIKSLSVNDFISDNQQAEWKHHAKLPQPGGISCFNSQPLYF